jgi:hypothetical protein
MPIVCRAGLNDSSFFRSTGKQVYQDSKDGGNSGGILGWEALTRGPRESYFRSPDLSFLASSGARHLTY